MEEKYAIVDIGSNTIRLVIFSKNKAGSFKEIQNIKTVARLRNYLNEEDKIINEEGCNVLYQTLTSFAEIIRDSNVTTVKCVATATIRQATNKDDILAKIREKTNLNIKVLSEYEEAYYGYLAVVNSTLITEGIIIDIGGGSTEVTYFKNRKIIHSHSFPFGALSLKKQFLSSEIVINDEILSLRAFLKSAFKKLPWLYNMEVPIIGIGGNARNIAQIDQGIKSYPLVGLHQYEMSYEDIYSIRSLLLNSSYLQLQKLKGLSNNRADIIIPAAEIYYALCSVVKTDKFILSRKGLREGLLYKERLKNSDDHLYLNVIKKAFNEIMYDYEIDLEQTLQLEKVAGKLFNEIKRHGFASFTERDRIHLKRASYLYSLGKYIDAEASSQHTFYLIANRTIDGLGHRDRLILALLASYKSKSFFKQYVEPFTGWLSKEEQQKLNIIGAILKLSYCLNTSNRNVVENIKLSDNHHNISFHIKCTKDFFAEQYQGEKQKKHLEKALKQTIKLYFCGMGN
jgi:exopolyphosphatase / guanosine-5'-triphosphate,3'-diphosphate pyrophosphatase